MPIGLSIFMNAAWKREDLMVAIRRWLMILRVITGALTCYMGYKSIGPIVAFLSM